MKTPRIEIDLQKIRENTRTLVDLLGCRGITVTGVTKAVCGQPDVAQAMLDGGAVGLADARISNVRRMRDAGITCPISLIRAPMLAEIDDVIRLCDTSYNTELETLVRLSVAAQRLGKEHDVILMVEMGDMREGILPMDVEAIASMVVKMPGIALKGIAANFACLGHDAPTPHAMAVLTRLANEVEGTCGPYISQLSGGSSSGISLALSDVSNGRLNNLRIGEAILLGIDPVTERRIDALHTDAFCLIAEVIETRWKPEKVLAQPLNPIPWALDLSRENSPKLRTVLAVGQQDTTPEGLSFPSQIEFVNATSDHTVVEGNDVRLSVGSEVKMGTNYSALMRAMNAPDVSERLLQMRRHSVPQGHHALRPQLTLVR